jgi:chromosomal replication initiator protein
MQAASGVHGDQSAQILAAARAAEEAAARAEEQAQRTAENMETLSVEEQRKRGLKGPGHAHRKKRKADAILGKAESDALESMEENGIELRIDERILAALESEAPLGGFTLDNFFTGKANQFAVKLARAVSEHPGSAYNPFFLHGGVGLGKTHLINGIGNLLIEHDPDLHVGYVSSSRFSRKLADALEEHALDEFREAYARWDVLIFDDIQFLGGRIEAQEEFFHLFNALYQEDRQIVIAGDRPPDQLGQLEDRLISRFGSGIVAALQPPEWETRLQILHHQVERANANVSEEILALIATKVSHDVRKMTGALRKVLAYSELMGADVSADLVSQILGHVGAEAPA